MSRPFGAWILVALVTTGCLEARSGPTAQGSGEDVPAPRALVGDVLSYFHLVAAEDADGNSTGRVYLAWTGHPNSSAPPAADRLRVAWREPGAADFREPVDVALPFEPEGVSAFAARGDVVVAVVASRTADGEAIHVVTSADGGTTWREPTPLGESLGGGAAAVVDRDGRVLVWLPADCGEGSCRGIAGWRSSDGGESFHRTEPLPISGGASASMPHAEVRPDGGIVLALQLDAHTLERRWLILESEDGDAFRASGEHDERRIFSPLSLSRLLVTDDRTRALARTPEPKPGLRHATVALLDLDSGHEVPVGAPPDHASDAQIPGVATIAWSSDGRVVAAAWESVTWHPSGLETELQVAISRDGGETFAAPLTVAEGSTGGRPKDYRLVALAVHEDSVLVAWLDAVHALGVDIPL